MLRLYTPAMFDQRSAFEGHAKKSNVARVSGKTITNDLEFVNRKNIKDKNTPWPFMDTAARIRNLAINVHSVRWDCG